jgi:hypothetical protein
MKTKYTFVTIALMVVVAWSCSSLDPIAPGSVNTGVVSFARFHVMGDNMVAGMQNAGLVEGFQKASFAADIAGAVPSTPHAFPNISENGIPPTFYVARFSPVRIDTLETVGAPTNLTFPGIYNNMGIPGATLNELLTKSPGLGDTNPFFGIVLRDTLLFGPTAVAQTAAAQPTLLISWVGWTDVYGSAMLGTDALMTTTASFEADYRTMMDTFDGAAAANVAANLPDLTDVPYFSTIPPIVINPATGQPVLDPGGQFIPLLGQSGPLPMTALVTLPASGYLAMGIGIPAGVPGGTDAPLPDAVVLMPTERDAITTRIGEFNTIIDTVCTNRIIPVVDMNALYSSMKTTGYEMRGETYTSAFLSGGLFSVDGLHPSSLGYYVISLEFIRVINSWFTAGIPDPVRPLGPFRDPALGATPPGTAAATISLEEWRRIWNLFERRLH